MDFVSEASTSTSTSTSTPTSTSTNARYFKRDPLLEDNDEYDIKTLEDLPSVQGAKFGDVISCYHYRECVTFIVGKDGKLVRNPDRRKAGYLSIPYEITQHLESSVNAVEFYSTVEDECCDCLTDIDLKYDDKFIIDNFGDLSCLGSSECSYMWCYSNEALWITFPNGIDRSFVPGTSPSDILLVKEGLAKEQCDITLEYDIEGDEVDRFNELHPPPSRFGMAKPVLPITWIEKRSRGGGNPRQRKRLVVLSGPADEKDLVQSKLAEYYATFNHTITD
jgi:hypothetical protein